MRTYKRDKTRLLGKPKCPVCHSKLDGFTPFVEDDKAVPKDGDISICIYCATPLQVVGDKWVKMDEVTLAEAMADKRFQVAMAVVKVHRKDRLG